MKELFDVFESIRHSLLRQAFEEHPPIALAVDAIVQHYQNAAIMKGTNQTAKSLLYRDHCSGNLVLHKRIATISSNRCDASCDYWIIGHSKRKSVDNHAAKLLALYVHSLPER